MATPVVAEPAADPEPLTVDEAQTSHKQAAVGVAVDRSPEEGVANAAILVPFPLFWDELLLGVEIVEHIDVQDRLFHELLAKLVAHDTLVALLVLRKAELYFRGIPLQESTPSVLFHVPAVREVGISVHVDNVLGLLDFASSSQEREYLTALLFAMSKACEILGLPSCLAACDTQFVH